jgi:hypothetical protein
MDVIAASHRRSPQICGFERRNTRFGTTNAARLPNNRNCAGINTTKEPTERNAF